MIRKIFKVRVQTQLIEWSKQIIPPIQICCKSFTVNVLPMLDSHLSSPWSQSQSVTYMQIFLNKSSINFTPFKTWWETTTLEIKTDFRLFHNRTYVYGEQQERKDASRKLELQIDNVEIGSNSVWNWMLLCQKSFTTIGFQTLTFLSKSLRFTLLKAQYKLYTFQQFRKVISGFR